MEKISVCLASYNGERYIERQLISILNQLNEQDEILISDDKSTDDTLKIIRSLNDSRIRLVVNEGVHGPVGNFEWALKLAVGDYIFLSDQDDIWMPEKISIIKPLLKDYDLVLSNCKVVDENNKILYNSFFEYRGSRPGFWHNVYKNSYMGCCMSFKREVLSYALPFPSNIHMHDWWIGLLTEAKGKVYFCPQPLIKYVRHGDNASPTGVEGYSFFKRFKNRLFLLINIAKRLRA